MDKEKGQHKRYICSYPDCEAAYNKQWKLDVHLCKHTGVKPYVCDYNGCGKTFCSKYHLSRHELSHTGIKPFSCTADGCTDAFTTNSNLLRHVARKHSADQKKYTCDVDGCGLVFKKHKQLKSHVCERHAQLPPCQCSFCPMRFTCPSKQKRHEKVHKGYPCREEGCPFTGKTWTEYLKHRKEAHRRFVKCDRCDKVFGDSWFLLQHQRVHSEERVVFKCPRAGCQRSYTTVFNLTSHINSFHEERRPFACTHEGCGKTFAMNQSLSRHSVVHDPERRKLKPRPTRSLASRLSGFRPSKKARKPRDDADSVSESHHVPGQNQAGPVELVSLLQDTAWLSHPTSVTDAQSPMTRFTPNVIELGQ